MTGLDGTQFGMIAGKQDHHFIPRFYSKRWARSGILCEFSRPRDVVKPRRTSTKGTGYVSMLYAIDNDETEPNRLEEGFYKPVDTCAADALALLEHDVANDAWPPRLRLAWARFVMTLLMRMPEDMALMEASYRKEFAYLTEEQERQWTAWRKPNWPVTLEAALTEQDVKAAASQPRRSCHCIAGRNLLVAAIGSDIGQRRQGAVRSPNRLWTIGHTRNLRLLH
jgi:hypothetical protein